MSHQTEPYDAIIIGAGIAGIYQAKMLADLGVRFIGFEANEDLGGTWFKNRYPGCRFDSESYTYGYKFSRELLDEWDWKEHFSPQPDNLKYLNFVAEKFDLRQYFRFGTRVKSMAWDEDAHLWSITLSTGEVCQTRFVVTCLGVLSKKFVPRIEGASDFGGEAFHTYDWPADPVQLAERKVGIIGTGATGIQVIPEIAGEVAELTVFQRHPNWSVPLNNDPISSQEMANIRSRYDAIFDVCNKSQGGFCHLPIRREYAETTPEERREFWDELYERRGFALLLANYRETFLEAQANRDLSNYVADRIRARVDDAETAEKLIPTNHGFGMRRLPLETRYFEAYNRDNVQLVDLNEAPIERITKSGIQTKAQHHDLDLIIYATGFQATTGGLSAIEITGTGGQMLEDKWRDDTSTYLGMMTRGFPNMLMVAGPQSVSGSTNYPQAIETGVEWVTALLRHTLNAQKTRVEASQAGEDFWIGEVAYRQDLMPFSKVRSWFTGYNPNAAKGASGFRYNNYWGGVPKYRKFLQDAADSQYSQVEFS